MHDVAPLRTIAPAGVRRPRPRLSFNIELLGLVATSISVLLGVLLVHAGKVARLDEVGGPAAVIPLYALKSPADLDPVLTMFTSPVERQAVALALYRRATAEPPLDHVGALADVTIPTATTHHLSRADIVSLKPRLAVRSLSQFNSSLARAVVVFIGAFWLAHLFRRWRGRSDDPLVLPALLLLCGIGLMTMIALRDPVRDTMSADMFASGAAIGMILLVAASEFDFEASPLRRAVLLPLGLALALATLLLGFGSGPGTSGVKVNLFGAQPVELIRLLVVLALAAYFGRRLELLRELSEPATPARPWLHDIRLPRWRDVRPVLASMGLVLAFFFLQKDLGPALVLSCVFLGLFGIARGRVGLVVAGFALLLIGFAGAYVTGVPSLVRHRVMIWSNPWDNGLPGGNQIAHGLWALATGGPWGSGAGLGSPTAIPEGHTDFVIAALGEELGFVALAMVVVLYAFLCWRCLRIALRAPGDFSTFLSVGVVLVISVQALVIAAGLLGLMPLAGVVTPFLSYGRSSMLANFLAVGLVLSVGRRQSEVREHMRQPVAVLAGMLGVAAGLVLLRAGWVQVVHADEIASASSLTEQADGGYRFEYNPRLLSAARTLTRGTIYDRNKLPIATSRPDEITALRTTYTGGGAVAPPEDCDDDAATRCYPLGGLAFHLLGNWTHQTNWAARNSSYLERDSDARLKGYDDRAAVVDVVNPRTGQHQHAIRRDFGALLPLARHRYQPDNADVRAMRSRDRDLQTSIDARLQMRVAKALRDGIVSGKFERGAAVVVDAGTGEVLAAASYPWPESTDIDGTDAGTSSDAEESAARLLDRARYGLYPPGSTFKLVIAGAALRTHQEADRFMCTRLPDGRVGAFVHGSSRPVRDDPMDTVPHGNVDLERGLIVSCNAYFAQLALAIGPRPVLDSAALFQIEVARSAKPEGLRPTLAQVGYGQGQAVVSPLKLARVSASIASGGIVAPVRWEPAVNPPKADAWPRFLSKPDADRIAKAMRSVVTAGTARALRGHAVAIAGKTGTAEIAGAPAHAWFTGFAPYQSEGRRIAFAVIVENAGYGNRAAAPIAGEIVSAAKELGLIK
jgi:cell division protein FtsW (lipid II flippase)/cell division protein FtsI/penicillin-binding protein 2